MATNAAIKLQIGATGPAGPSPSGAQNLVLATPNGSSGVAVLRALVVADLPFTPINKAGDTGIGNLAMGTLSATTLYGLTASPPSAGGMGYQAAQGVLIWAKTGSSYDFCVINPANNSYILYVPTGTVNTVFVGTVSALQLTTTNGYVSSATGNLIFTPPGANSIYMNYGGGTGGVKFYDGTTNVVASMSSAGALTANAVNITGSGGVAVPAGGTYTDGYITWGSAQMNRTGGYIELQYGGLTGDGVRIFGSKAYPITFDLGTIQQTPVAFASLPTGATGKRGFVNNNSAGAAFGSAANGSGAITYPVYHDGVSWKVG